jgi:YD repeat-containing protein
MVKDIGASNQTASFTYDRAGNMVTATDQATNRTRRAFDALNRLYQVTDPASGLTVTGFAAHTERAPLTAVLAAAVLQL